MLQAAMNAKATTAKRVRANLIAAPYEGEEWVPGRVTRPHVSWIRRGAGTHASSALFQMFSDNR